MRLAWGCPVRWTAVPGSRRSASISGLAARSLGGLVGITVAAPVTLANDGNCAVLGEQWLGAAKGVDDVVLLTLGTGVGGGVILGGQLFLAAAVRRRSLADWPGSGRATVQ